MKTVKKKEKWKSCPNAGLLDQGNNQEHTNRIGCQVKKREKMWKQKKCSYLNACSLEATANTNKLSRATNFKIGFSN